MVLSKSKPRVPGWLLTLLVAAMAPLTGAAISYGQLRVQQEKGDAELALAQARQGHDFRMAYFEKAVVGESERREAVLRFLAASFQDPDLRSWAAEELALREDEKLAACILARDRCSKSCIEHMSIPAGLERKAAEEFRVAHVRECFDACMSSYSCTWKPDDPLPPLPPLEWPSGLAE